VFDQLGVTYIDHVAVTTNDFEATSAHYLSLQNVRIIRGPGWNSAQKVHYLFVSFGGDLCIEILGLPKNQDSPIAAHVANGGGAYHICYAVDDLDNALSQAMNLGAKIICDPRADDAYDGRRVSFLIHPLHGLFELVEALGVLNVKIDSNEKKAELNLSDSQNIQDDHNTVQAKIKNAFRNIFSNALPLEYSDWSVKKINGWDSLRHLRLIMEIERSLDIHIPSQILSELTNYDEFVLQVNRLLNERK
jgi:acyl carrier protein/predicted enzyme related to lactoylglutathione lyase